MSLPLASVMAVAAGVQATRSRSAKRDALAALLRDAGPQEAEILVGLLLGSPRQGRVGVGWRTVRAVDENAGTTGAPTLTLGDVDAAYDKLADTHGPGSARSREEILTTLWTRASTAERTFLRGTLLGDLRTGALAGVLTDALAVAIDKPSAAVRRAVMLGGSLGASAARLLADPDAVDQVTLTVGTPVQPMLAATADDSADALRPRTCGGLLRVEYKLDGARIQVHKRQDAIAVFTRTHADITARVPEIVALVETFPADSLILDGETLTLDPSGAPRPFQETMSRFGSGGSHDAMLAAWFFDILHLDGRDLIDEPLTQRLDVLAGVVGEHQVPGVFTTDVARADQVLAEMLTEALAAGHEGVMVKDGSSRYAAGRRGTAWRKVKPVHTLDLVVLAAEWGYGRRTGWLSNLHLGARDPNPMASDTMAPVTPGGQAMGGQAVGGQAAYVMVGKTYKGLTDELLRWQTATFPGYAVRETAGVLWLRPELVVEVAIDGVQRSPRYPGGVALRFARVRGYRPDKAAAQADTIDAVRALLR